MVDLGLLVASPGDLLRLSALPILGWAAWRDVETRRVPNRAWLPLAALGIALLAWDAWRALEAGGADWRLFALRAGISLGFLVPFAYLFWALGGFGGADAKAVMVLAILFPTYPEYLLGSPLPDLVGVGTLPVVDTAVGVFAFTVLTNAVLAGAVYPLGVAARNAAAGRITLAMFVGRPIPVDDLSSTHGRLLETPRGFTRRGMDLDALRMYLRWRRADLADLRSNPAEFRDPDSLPATPGDPGDGAVRTDGGSPPDAGEDPTTGAGEGSTSAPADGAEAGGDDVPDDEAGTESQEDDPWGAAAFVEDVGEPYGTTAGDLRDGLEVVSEADDVWISPGLPFMVPLFAGLVVGIVYGDLLFGALMALGLV